MFLGFCGGERAWKKKKTVGVRANVEPKSSIPIGAKVGINPKGFTLGIKSDSFFKKFNLPQILINAELYGLVLAPRLKKRYHQIWEAKNVQSSPPNSFGPAS
jgi:hypothetical protein